MAQLKIGALRDFQHTGHQVHLVQKGTICQLAGECEKEYLVHDAPENSITVDQNNNLVTDCSSHKLYHYDNFEEAQAKYLKLRDLYGAATKVDEFLAGK